MTVQYVNGRLDLSKSIVLTVFTNYMTRKANGMTSVVSYMNQNSSYRGKF